MTAAAPVLLQVRVLRPEAASFPCRSDQTLLDAALQVGVALPYGCGMGRCGACKARVVEGRFRRLDTRVNRREPPPDVIYACCTRPLTDMALSYGEP